MSLSLDEVGITLGGRTLVHGVSVELHPGEVVGLLGPNGAGKTTTFNLVTGLLRPDRGDVSLDGVSVTQLPMPQRARLGIGYLPQEASVFRNLTVRENLQLALQESGTPPAVRRTRLESLIQDFHLVPFQHRKGYQLSGGERRRCEVARALAGRCRCGCQWLQAVERRLALPQVPVVGDMRHVKLVPRALHVLCIILRGPECHHRHLRQNYVAIHEAVAAYS